VRSCVRVSVSQSPAVSGKSSFKAYDVTDALIAVVSILLSRVRTEHEQAQARQGLSVGHFAKVTQLVPVT
jgi:hypothetical protein